MSPATRPPPDFYRIVRQRIEDGNDEYAYYPLGSSSLRWTTNRCDAAGFVDGNVQTHAEALGGRIVPVRVTVRKVPRQHDFAWALRKMREGKRVRQRAWLNPKRFWEIARANTKYETIMTNGIGESDNGTARWGIEADGSDLLATDWELVP